jgi:hypothetical protein
MAPTFAAGVGSRLIICVAMRTVEPRGSGIAAAVVGSDWVGLLSPVPEEPPEFEHKPQN